MAKKHTRTSSHQRTMRSYQIVMGIIGVIVILAMILSLVR